MTTPTPLEQLRARYFELMQQAVSLPFPNDEIDYDDPVAVAKAEKQLEEFNKINAEMQAITEIVNGRCPN